MKKVTVFICLLIYSTVSYSQQLSGVNSQKITVQLGKKTVKGKSIYSLRASSLEKGVYAFELSDGSSLQFKVNQGGKTDYYDSNSKKIAASQMGFECQGFVCTCNPDQNPADCDDMINQTGCKPVIDIDGKTYCIRGLELKGVKNNKIILVKRNSLTVKEKN